MTSRQAGAAAHELRRRRTIRAERASDIPNGIEFDIAEIGSASSKAKGPVRFELEDTYGQFNTIHLTGRGAVHARV